MPTMASTNSAAEAGKNGTPAAPPRRRVGDERPPGPPRHGAGEQRLAGAGAPGEQHAAGYPPAQLAVAVRVAQEVDDLGGVGLGLVDAGDVLEAPGGLGALPPAGARAAERPERAELAAAARGGAAGHPDEERDEQDDRAEAEDQAG